MQTDDGILSYPGNEINEIFQYIYYYCKKHNKRPVQFTNQAAYSHNSKQSNIPYPLGFQRLGIILREFEGEHGDFAHQKGAKNQRKHGDKYGACNPGGKEAAGLTAYEICERSAEHGAGRRRQAEEGTVLTGIHVELGEPESAEHSYQQRDLAEDILPEHKCLHQGVQHHGRKHSEAHKVRK